MHNENSLIDHPLQRELVRLPLAEIERCLALLFRSLHVSPYVFHPLIPRALTAKDPFADDAAALLWQGTQMMMAPGGGILKVLLVDWIFR